LKGKNTDIARRLRTPSDRKGAKTAAATKIVEAVEQKPGEATFTLYLGPATVHIWIATP
jgi:hypothetical protein